MHGECYQSLPGFGITFEAFVGLTLAEYVLEAGAKGRIWMAERDGRLIGCTALVLRDGNFGQIRWVLVDPSARGIGLGKELVNRALAWSRDMGCTRIFLETTDGVPESQSLYETLGFEVVSDEPAEHWDGVRPLIRMEMDL